MIFAEKKEESSSKLIATALSINLIILSLIVSSVMDMNLIAFSLKHPDGNILILLMVLLLILTYMNNGISGLFTKILSYFD